MKDRGIKNIEGLIITHFDNDHSGGAVDIMKNLKVKEVYINSFNDKTMTSISIYKTIKEMKIPVQIPKNNSRIYFERDLNMQAFIADKQEDNEKSVITLLSFKDFDMLFTGDAGIQAFNSIKNNLPNKVEVLKVGHHGGPHVVDNNMLNFLNTQTSIISTGPNAFGHPNKGTLDILRNTDIYRTDRHNSIKITSDGKSYNIFLYTPQKRKFILSKKADVIN